MMENFRRKHGLLRTTESLQRFQVPRGIQQPMNKAEINGVITSNNNKKKIGKQVRKYVTSIRGIEVTCATGPQVLVHIIAYVCLGHDNVSGAR